MGKTRRLQKYERQTTRIKDKYYSYNPLSKSSPDLATVTAKRKVRAAKRQQVFDSTSRFNLNPLPK